MDTILPEQDQFEMNISKLASAVASERSDSAGNLVAHQCGTQLAVNQSKAQQMSPIVNVVEAGVWEDAVVCSEPSVLVLGIGNLLWADEGFGVRAVEELHRTFDFPGNVRLMDGGTQGIYLVQHVREADVLVVFDAVDYGLPPGTLKLVEGEEVPKFLGARKVSLHQTGFQEVLAMAEMMGDYPSHLLLIGVQPVELDDYGGSLRPDVKAQIKPSIAHALSYLAKFGVTGSRRSTPLSEADTIVSNEMVLARYEGERPDEKAAMRHGDERILSSDDWQGPTDFEAEMEQLVSRTPGAQ